MIIIICYDCMEYLSGTLSDTTRHIKVQYYLPFCLGCKITLIILKLYHFC